MTAYAQSIRGRAYVLGSYAARLAGRLRVANDALSRYELYLGTSAAPDFTAAPYQTFAAFPFTTPAIAAAGTYHFVLRQRNRWNLPSQNLDAWTLVVDGSLNPVAPPPSDPFAITLSPGAACTVRVTARYDYLADGPRAADHFLIYVRSDGSNPNPATDAPAVVAMIKADGTARLNWTSAAFAEAATVKVILRTRRAGTPNADSGSAAILTTTATAMGPAAPAAQISLGS